MSADPWGHDAPPPPPSGAIPCALAFDGPGSAVAIPPEAPAAWERSVVARFVLVNATADDPVWDRLVRLFGGYTAAACRGGWRAPDGSVAVDRGYVVDVAIPLGSAAADLRRLRAILVDYAKARGEQCVYVSVSTAYTALVTP